MINDKDVLISIIIDNIKKSTSLLIEKQGRDTIKIYAKTHYIDIHVCSIRLFETYLGILRVYKHNVTNIDYSDLDMDELMLHIKKFEE